MGLKPDSSQEETDAMIMAAAKEYFKAADMADVSIEGGHVYVKIQISSEEVDLDLDLDLEVSSEEVDSTKRGWSSVKEKMVLRLGGKSQAGLGSKSGDDSVKRLKKHLGVEKGAHYDEIKEKMSAAVGMHYAADVHDCDINSGWVQLKVSVSELAMRHEVERNRKQSGVKRGLGVTAPFRIQDSAAQGVHDATMRGIGPLSAATTNKKEPSLPANRRGVGGVRHAAHVGNISEGDTMQRGIGPLYSDIGPLYSDIHMEPFLKEAQRGIGSPVGIRQQDASPVGIDDRQQDASPVGIDDRQQDASLTGWQAVHRNLGLVASHASSAAVRDHLLQIAASHFDVTVANIEIEMDKHDPASSWIRVQGPLGTTISCHDLLERVRSVGQNHNTRRSGIIKGMKHMMGEKAGLGGGSTNIKKGFGTDAAWALKGKKQSSSYRKGLMGGLREALECSLCKSKYSASDNACSHCSKKASPRIDQGLHQAQPGLKERRDRTGKPSSKYFRKAMTGQAKQRMAAKKSSIQRHMPEDLNEATETDEMADDADAFSTEKTAELEDLPEISLSSDVQEKRDLRADSFQGLVMLGDHEEASVAAEQIRANAQDAAEATSEVVTASKEGQIKRRGGSISSPPGLEDVSAMGPGLEDVSAMGPGLEDVSAIREITWMDNQMADDGEITWMDNQKLDTISSLIEKVQMKKKKNQENGHARNKQNHTIYKKQRKKRRRG